MPQMADSPSTRTETEFTQFVYFSDVFERSDCHSFLMLTDYRCPSWILVLYGEVTTGWKIKTENWEDEKWPRLTFLVTKTFYISIHKIYVYIWSHIYILYIYSIKHLLYGGTLLNIFCLISTDTIKLMLWMKLNE